MKVFVGIALLVATASSAAFAEDAPKVKDRKSPDYVRCVSQAETGSLVKKRKTCRTNAEWDKIEAAQQNDASDLVERSRTFIVPGS
ncbi:hypothetical protein [Sphingomonas crocodyli]|uniref:Uncharacterized protein n=1 Tax=Sphingomonas crocodyli TaxID=1979270 RepID=A0A437M5J6_9SPHN|nr:hypothetical protein [Sphingomonas crocodyli]RVT92744.1 hypothetical protein EOD43_02145 [Sphingomonas crocodyli]